MRTLLCSLILLIPFNCLAAPDVVVSIKPLHSLTSAVMRGIATPKLLLRGGNSPHSYALRSSDARALSNAELIIWIGPELETFLSKPLASLATKAKVLELLRQKQLLRLHQRAGGSWEDDNDHGHNHDHSAEEALNPHLWLDPHNAIKIVTLLQSNLAAIDPQNAERYRNNANQLIIKLKQLASELQIRLRPLQNRPYLVFHDAYPYLEQRYQLQAIGSIAISPDRQPGARHIAEIRDKVAKTQASCIFSEPQFQPRLVEMLVNSSNLKSAELDPLGTDLAAGPQAYFQLLNNLADNLSRCLQQ